MAYWRARWVTGRLPEQRRALLGQVGMAQRAAMGNKEARWWEILDELTAHHRAHGSLTFPATTPQAKWLVHQRQRRRVGQLTDEQIAALDTLGMVWEPQPSRRQGQNAPVVSTSTPPAGPRAAADNAVVSHACAPAGPPAARCSQEGMPDA